MQKYGKIKLGDSMLLNKGKFRRLLVLIVTLVLALAIAFIVLPTNNILKQTNSMEPKATQGLSDKYINDTAMLAGNIADVSYNKTGFNIEYLGISAELDVGKDNQLIDLTIGNVDASIANANISDVNISDRIDNEENDEIIEHNDILEYDEILVLVGDKGSTYANELIIYKILLDLDASQIHIEELYRNQISAIKAWKIGICELDNDGVLEIFIAANKATHYYPEVENRPFFFNFIDGMLVKKWTGSKVRAPFKDVYFFDINGNKTDEFIVIERVDGIAGQQKSLKQSEHNEPLEQYVIAVYYWFGFGFILQAESPRYDAINSISMVSDGDSRLIEAEVIEGNETKVVLLIPTAQKSDDGIYLLKERMGE